MKGRRQQVGALLPVPGPAPETREAGSPSPVTQRPLIADPARLEEPIGSVTPEGAPQVAPARAREANNQTSSWKDNHDRTLRARDDRDLAASVERSNARKLEAVDPPPVKRRATRPAPKATSEATRPPKRAVPTKKPAADQESGDTEVDFGI